MDPSPKPKNAFSVRKQEGVMSRKAVDRRRRQLFKRYSNMPPRDRKLENIRIPDYLQNVSCRSSEAGTVGTPSKVPTDIHISTMHLVLSNFDFRENNDDAPRVNSTATTTSTTISSSSTDRRITATYGMVPNNDEDVDYDKGITKSENPIPSVIGLKPRMYSSSLYNTADSVVCRDDMIEDTDHHDDNDDVECAISTDLLHTDDNTYDDDETEDGDENDDVDSDDETVAINNDTVDDSSDDENLVVNNDTADDFSDENVAGNDDAADDSSDEETNIFAKKKRNNWSRQMNMKTNVTKLDAIANILSVAIRSNLTYTAVMQLLKNLDGMLVDSTLPRTIKSLWSVLSRNDKEATTRHYYCPLCKGMMGKNDELLELCSCKTFGPGTKRNLLSYFIQVKLAPQLRDIFANPTTVNSLRYRFTRDRKDANGIEDMYDGVEYKKMCEPGKFLSNENNFSFTLNTDGCKVSKSSSASAWPILLQINELPPHARKRHILLAGIWVDVAHPNLNALLLPTMKELHSLYHQGITWKHPIHKNEITSKFVTLVCSVDTPARADILNMTRFNGKYGCSFCYAEGETSASQVYPIDDTVLCRTNAQIKQHMTEAHTKKTRVYGVKGISSLLILPEFDLYSGMIVETMHELYLGVGKLHTTLLLQGNATEPYYIGTPTNIEAINSLLEKIRRPTRISRNTRSIREMKDWKATEWRNWVLYYMLICLEDKARDRDLRHLALLSRAAYILDKDCIRVEELEEARLLLKQYAKQFQATFGKQNMRFNVHLLSHVVDTIKNWGPIWVHSAFPFESWNKKITEKVTSANSRCLQIVTRYMMTRFIEGLIHDPSVPQRTKNMITNTLTDGSKTRGILVDETRQLVKFNGIGSAKNRPPSRWEYEVLNSAGFDGVKELSCYKRALIHNIDCKRHMKQSNEKETRYCNEYIYYESFGFAKILEIVRFDRKNDVVHGLFVQLFSSMSNAFGAKHIINVAPSTTRAFLNTVKEIPTPTIVIESTSGLRAIKLPNVWETD